VGEGGGAGEGRGQRERRKRAARGPRGALRRAEAERGEEEGRDGRARTPEWASPAAAPSEHRAPRGWVKRVYHLFTTRPQTADKNINVER